MFSLIQVFSHFCNQKLPSCQPSSQPNLTGSQEAVVEFERSIKSQVPIPKVVAADGLRSQISEAHCWYFFFRHYMPSQFCPFYLALTVQNTPTTPVLDIPRYLSSSCRGTVWTHHATDTTDTTVGADNRLARGDVTGNSARWEKLISFGWGGVGWWPTTF